MAAHATALRLRNCVLLGLFRTLGAVLRAGLLAILDALQVKRTAHDVVTHARQILDTTTTECSCRLWPSPPMYEMTSKPLVRRTLATLRRAEFGFLGVVVYTRVHTPRRWGQFSSAGLLLLTTLTSRGLRTSWLMVGITSYSLLSLLLALSTTRLQHSRFWAARANPPSNGSP